MRGRCAVVALRRRITVIMRMRRMVVPVRGVALGVRMAGARVLVMAGRHALRGQD